MPATPAVWLLLAGVLVSAAVSEAWRRHALRSEWLDLPDARRLHQQPTPRGGGLAILVVLLAGAPWLGGGAAAFALGLAITAGAGMVDDLRPLPPLAKLALQAVGALPLAWLAPVMPLQLGAFGGVALAWFIVLVAVNFWNFMDGSNGMAACQGLLVGLAVALLMGTGSQAGWLGALLAAACLGFLPSNIPSARLFLGDVGSHALGYAVAAMVLMGLGSGGLSPWQALLLPSAFLLDAGITLVSRIARRQRVWRAHREHLYQRAVTAGRSHMAVMGAYAAWTAGAALVAGAMAEAPGKRQLLVLATVLAVGTGLRLCLGRRWPRGIAQPRMES